MAETKKAVAQNIYTFDGKISILSAIPFGLQHVLAMFVANITPIFIIAGACGISQNDTAVIIQTAMIIAGIGTLIQLFPIWKIGARLPVVMGVSFTFVSIACIVGAKYGYAAILGSVLIGGCVEGLLGLFAKYWLKIISPICSATVVIAIGFSLFSVGARSFGGGYTESFGSVTNWILGSVTLMSCILFNAFAKSYLKTLSFLFGMIIGYILACMLGAVDFSVLKNVDVFSFPPILKYGLSFKLDAIIAFVIVFLISATETIGDTTALVSAGFDRDITQKEISGSLCCDGFISVLSSLIGCMPVTSFSQNVGLVAISKVVNRFAIATGGIILIIAGNFPIIGALLSTLPQSVLGGCTIMMFGTIVVTGFQMISKCGFTQRNVMIVALCLSIGIGFTSLDVQGLFSIFPTFLRSVCENNSVAVVFVAAVILNLAIPKDKKENE